MRSSKISRQQWLADFTLWLHTNTHLCQRFMLQKNLPKFYNGDYWRQSKRTFGIGEVEMAMKTAKSRNTVVVV